MSKTYSTTDTLALHDKAFRVTAHEAGVRPLGGVGEGVAERLPQDCSADTTARSNG